jgi:hypothetical protein
LRSPHCHPERSRGTTSVATLQRVCAMPCVSLHRTMFVRAAALAWFILTSCAHQAPAVRTGCSYLKAHDPRTLESTELSALRQGIERELLGFRAVDVAGQWSVVQETRLFIPNSSTTRKLLRIWEKTYEKYHTSNGILVVSVLVVKPDGRDFLRVLSPACPVSP